MARDQTTPPDGAGLAHLHASQVTGEPAVADRPTGFAAVVATGKGLFERVKQTRAYRANARFGRRGGGVLTGGIAYSALFSVFAGLTIGWTVFMAVLGSNDELRQQVLDAIDSFLPGLVDTGDGTGGAISPDSLALSPGLTIAGIVAAVVFLFSAVSAMAALRTGVRAMFGEPPTAGNAVLAQVRALAGFAGMGLAILLSAVLSIVTTSAADWIGSVVDLGDLGQQLVRLLGLAVAFVVDAGIFVMVVLVLSHQRPARRDLLGGAAIAALGIGVVRYLGTAVVAGSVSRNPVLGAGAALATLLIWINLIGRIVLLSAAWVADPPLPDDEDAEDSEGDEDAAEEEDSVRTPG